MPAGELQRIFDRYYIERHAEASNEPVESHFGIGLSIARRNVEAMGATIEAEHRTPHGLAAHLRLPLATSGDKGGVTAEAGGAEFGAPADEPH